MHAVPSLLPLTEAAARELGSADPGGWVEVGRRYEAAMRLAGEYAYAGREHVAGEVLRIVGAEAVETVHNHHNYAWNEEHGGGTVHVSESKSEWSTGVGFVRPTPKLIRAAISSAIRGRSARMSSTSSDVRTAITPQPMS